MISELHPSESSYLTRRFHDGLLMNSPAGRPCWIGAGLSNLLEAQVRDISATGATVALATVVALPEEECNLYFTSDCKVGRRCIVVRQEGAELILSFQGRIGPPDSNPPDVIEIE